MKSISFNFIANSSISVTMITFKKKQDSEIQDLQTYFDTHFSQITNVSNQSIETIKRALSKIHKYVSTINDEQHKVVIEERRLGINVKIDGDHITDLTQQADIDLHTDTVNAIIHMFEDKGYEIEDFDIYGEGPSLDRH